MGGFVTLFLSTRYTFESQEVGLQLSFTNPDGKGVQETGSTCRMLRARVDSLWCTELKIDILFETTKCGWMSCLDGREILITYNFLDGKV
jgi:hypothetical protein